MGCTVAVVSAVAAQAQMRGWMFVQQHRLALARRTRSSLRFAPLLAHTPRGAGASRPPLVVQQSEPARLAKAHARTGTCVARVLQLEHEGLANEGFAKALCVT
jgi:hypothetical protein